MSTTAARFMCNFTRTNAFVVDLLDVVAVGAI